MQIIWIFSIIMLVVGVMAHIASFILEKKYKNKIKTMTSDIKSEKYKILI